VVILDKNDYIAKMNVILDDNSKFCKIGPVETKDNTATIEEKIQRRLLETTERQHAGRVRIQDISTLRIPKTQNVWPTQDSQNRCTPCAINFQ